MKNVNLIPKIDTNYVPFGFHKDLKNIIKSKKFYPVYIAGESGLGKNAMVEDVCAILKREMIRFNFSVETDHITLFGGPTLVDGNIVYNDGPIITGMKRGAVVFLDEFSKGNADNIVALNGILDGKPYLNPHTHELIYPAEGFNIIAASNSKGKGDDSGKYLENIMDDSVLERFPITIVQEEPSEKTEIKILSQYLNDIDFTEKLVKWSRAIRKSYRDGAVSDSISIRRLVHIAKSYDIFNDKSKAIQYCINRYDDEISTAFFDLYTKVDSGIDLDSIPEEQEVSYS